MNIHIRVKFRAFGITIGTFEELVPLIRIVPARNASALTLILEQVPSGFRKELVNRQGVLVEVVKD